MKISPINLYGYKFRNNTEQSKKNIRLKNMTNISFQGDSKSFLSAQLSRIFSADAVKAVDRKERVHDIIDRLLTSAKPEQRQEGIEKLIELISSPHSSNSELAEKILAPYRAILGCVDGVADKLDKLAIEKRSTILKLQSPECDRYKTENITKMYNSGLEAGLAWIRRLIILSERNKDFINSIENGVHPPEKIDISFAESWLKKTKNLLEKFEIELAVKKAAQAQEERKRIRI